MRQGSHIECGNIGSVGGGGGDVFVNPSNADGDVASNSDDVYVNAFANSDNFSGASVNAFVNSGNARRLDFANCDFINAITQNPYLLAPMAGWTDVSFRSICKDFGAGLTYTEMVSAEGLAHKNAKTAEYLEVAPNEDKIVVQLFGSNPEVMAREAAQVCEHMDKMGKKLCAIDVNMGCPARKVVRKGEGAALMKTPLLASKIVEAMSKEATVPITAKFRRGFERGNETAVDFAKRMEQAGAAAVCVHGRYAADFYSGTSSLGVIKRVKDALSIPVIASGDLLSVDNVLHCEKQTAADAFMIARGAQGNPWIFEELRRARMQRAQTQGRQMQTSLQVPVRAHLQVSLKEKLRVMRKHVELLYASNPRDVIKMRTYFSAYFKGMPAASKYRGLVVKCSTLEDFEAFFEQIWDDALEHGVVDG